MTAIPNYRLFRIYGKILVQLIICPAICNTTCPARTLHSYIHPHVFVCAYAFAYFPFSLANILAICILQHVIKCGGTRVLCDIVCVCMYNVYVEIIVAVYVALYVLGYVYV